MLVRGRAELSKGFFCLMQTQNYLGHDLSRAGKNARPAAVSGGELGAGCAVEPAVWKTDVEFFPALGWAAPRELLCLFPGTDNSPEKVL